MSTPGRHIVTFLQFKTIVSSFIFIIMFDIGKLFEVNSRPIKEDGPFWFPRVVDTP